eukprot:4121076-Prymnesium_polylepis.1
MSTCRTQMRQRRGNRPHQSSRRDGYARQVVLRTEPHPARANPPCGCAIDDRAPDGAVGVQRELAAVLDDVRPCEPDADDTLGPAGVRAAPLVEAVDGRRLVPLAAGRQTNAIRGPH